MNNNSVNTISKLFKSPISRIKHSRDDSSLDKNSKLKVINYLI